MSNVEEYIEELKSRFHYSEFEKAISDQESAQYFSKITSTWPVKPTYKPENAYRHALGRAQYIYQNMVENLDSTEFHLEYRPAIAFLPTGDFNAHVTSTPDGEKIIVLDIFLKAILNIICTELVNFINAAAKKSISKSDVENLLLLISLSIDAVRRDYKAAKIVFEWAKSQDEYDFDIGNSGHILSENNFHTYLHMSMLIWF